LAVSHFSSVATGFTAFTGYGFLHRHRSSRRSQIAISRRSRPAASRQVNIIAAVSEAPVIEKTLMHLDGQAPTAARLTASDAGIYSSNWSASEVRTGDKVIPRALAVLRLITISSLVGNSTGNSAGAPARLGRPPLSYEGRRIRTVPGSGGSGRLQTICTSIFPQGIRCFRQQSLWYGQRHEALRCRDAARSQRTRLIDLLPLRG
jgi:hypothetical protein